MLIIFFGLGPVVDVIKLCLEEIQISPFAETARIGHFRSDKKCLNIVYLKITLF